MRRLLLLFPVVAILLGIWTSHDVIPYTSYARGDDWVYSTDRFEIVLEGYGDMATGGGDVQIGGLGWEGGNGRFQRDGKTVLEQSYGYSWGTLTFRFNDTSIALRDHGREVVVNGDVCRITGRAIIRIDVDGGVSVEDRHGR